MSKLLNKKNITIVVILIAVIFAWMYYSSQKENVGQYDTIIAQPADLINEVSVTGDIVPAQEADLAFEQSSAISAVYANVGDSVYIGQTLVKQKSADLYATLSGAQSELETQKAILAELKIGTREEELAIYEAKLSASEKTLIEANIDIVHKISDSFTRGDNAIRNDADQLFSNPRGTNPTFNFTVSSQQLKTEIELGRFSVEEILNVWAKNLPNTNEGDISSYLNTALKNISEVKALLDKISLAVNALTSSGSLTQSTIDGYKADISGARTSINIAITNLNTVNEKLSSAQSSLIITQKELELKRAGATTEQIDAQEAKIKSAKANIANIRALIAKKTLKAPFGGIITKQEAEVGEIASVNVVIVSLISNGAFEIEAFVPEADIAKISIGNFADFTLDAYEDDVVFNAEVYAINPAETIIEGVSTYKVIFMIKNSDDRIRTGMTANIEILTAQKSDVIALPSRTVLDSGDGKYIRVLLKDGTIEKRAVQTGLRGSDGRVEIVSGIREGEEVVTFERK